MRFYKFLAEALQTTNFLVSIAACRYFTILTIYNFTPKYRFNTKLMSTPRFLMVFMCLSLSVFSTIEEYEAKAGIVLFYMETVVVVWFAIEFFLR